MSINIFEVATREKYRFNYKGLISVSDLWDLSTTELDLIFKDLNSQLKKTKEEESLLQIKTKEDKELEIKIEIIKHIVKIKVDEQTSKLLTKERKEKKQKILEILSEKQEEGLKNKSIEELTSMLNDIED